MRSFSYFDDKPLGRWLIWGCYLALWTTLLVMPYPETGLVFDLSLLRKYLVAKAGHFCAYALLAILSGWLRLALRGRLVLLFFLMFHAAATEWVQLELVYRSGTVADVVLDQAGILTGLLLSWRWWSAPA